MPSAAIAATLANSPVTNSNFTMSVMNKGNGLRTQVVFIPGNIKIRTSTSTGWTSWYNPDDRVPNAVAFEAPFIIAANSSKVLTVSNGFKGVVFLTAASNTNQGAIMLSSTSAGAVNYVKLGLSTTQVTFTTATGKLTIANASGAAQLTVLVLIMSGSVSVS